MSLSRSTKLVLGIVFVFLSVATLIYYPSVNGPFLLDDFENIPATNLSSFDVRNILFATFSNQSGPFGRPISILSFILNHKFFGTDPLSFKVINLATHILCSLLLALLARNLLTFLEYKKPYVSAIAVLVGFIWLIHPIQLSTASYVVQRMTQLMTVFTIMSLCFYSFARLQHIKGPSLSISSFVLIALSFFFAIFSKENGVLILVYLLLLEMFIFRLYVSTKCQKYFVLYFLCIFSIIPIIIGATYFALNFESIVNGYGNRPFSMSERILTQFTVFTHYLKIIFLPNINFMNLYYDDFPVRSTIDSQVIFGFSLIVALIFSAFYYRNRFPMYSFGITLYFSSHLIESTIFPLELVFEHRNYFGLFGLILAALTISAYFFHKFMNPQLPKLILPIIIAFLCLQTHARANTWSNDIILNKASIEKSPNSKRAKLAHVASLMKNNRYDIARETLDEVISENPNHPLYRLLSIQIDCFSGNNFSEDINKIEGSLKSFKYKDQALAAIPKLQASFEHGQCQQHAQQISERLYSALIYENKGRISKGQLEIAITNLAAIYFQTGRIYEALSLLENFELHESKNPELLIRMAWLYALTGDKSSSELLLSKAKLSKSVKIGLHKHELDIVSNAINSIQLSNGDRQEISKLQ